MSLSKQITEKYLLDGYSSRTKKIAILDTETLGIVEPRIYDFGLLIGDLNGNVIYKEQFIIEEVYESKKMQTAFYKSKMPIYDKRISEGSVTVGKFWEASKKVNEILQDFNVKTLGAFNLPFDEKALKFSARHYKYLDEFIKRQHQYERVDLWTLACEFIGSNPKFWEFCIENGFYSKAGNLKTNAEVMYAFITGNPKYKEEHLSIDDCIIEYEIFDYILKSQSKIKMSDIYGNVKTAPYRLTNFDKSLLD